MFLFANNDKNWRNLEEDIELMAKEMRNTQTSIKRMHIQDKITSYLKDHSHLFTTVEEGGRLSDKYYNLNFDSNMGDIHSNHDYFVNGDDSLSNNDNSGDNTNRNTNDGYNGNNKCVINGKYDSNVECDINSEYDANDKYNINS